jgi:hypothetical protein
MILLPSAAIIREEWKPKSSKFGSEKKQPTQGYEVAAAPCTTFQLAWLGLAAASPTEGGQRCHVDGWVKVCIPSANRFIHQLTHNPSSMRCPQTGPVANLGFHPALWKSLFEQMTAMSLTHSHLISSPICALTPGPEPAPVEPVEQPRHRGGVLPCFAPLSAHGGRHGLLEELTIRLRRVQQKRFQTGPSLVIGCWSLFPILPICMVISTVRPVAIPPATQGGKGYPNKNIYCVDQPQHQCQ